MLTDRARWDALTLRPSDVIVATPYKAGTTWTQYLCAMAIHGGPARPLPLSELSTWLDGELEDDTIRRNENQPWRRVIKTRTPLDGLPYREDISFVVCARDPRDAFLSMRDHSANFKPERRAEMLRAAGLPEDAKLLPDDIDEMFRVWMTTPAHPWMQDGFPFGPYFHHFAGFLTRERYP